MALGASKMGRPGAKNLAETNAYRFEISLASDLDRLLLHTSIYLISLDLCDVGSRTGVLDLPKTDGNQERFENRN